MVTYNDICLMKYDLQHKGLRDWAIRYGIIDLVWKIKGCLTSAGYGYLGNIKISRHFLNTLSSHDKEILDKAKSFIENK